MNRNVPKRILYAVSVLPNDPCISHLALASRAFSGLLNFGPNVEIGVVFTGERALHHKDEEWLLTDEHCQNIKNQLFNPLSEKNRSRLHLYFGPENVNQDSWKSCYEWIERFAPDIVYCWLGIFATSFLRPWLFKRYPLNVIQFSGENYQPGLCDGIVTISPLVKLNCSEHIIQKFVPGPFITENGQHMEPPTELKSKHHVITPLQGRRLSRAVKNYTEKMSEELTEVFFRFSASWSLFGEEDYDGMLEQNLSFKQLKDAGILQCNVFDFKLQATLSKANLLFYPPGTIGGGGSAFNAIVSGVPVLAPASSDSANFISQDDLYLDKEEMLLKLERVLSDEIFRHYLVKKQQDFLRMNNTVEAYACNLIEFADIVQNRSKRRLFSPSC